MDPAALLNPRGAQRGSKPTPSSFGTPSSSFSFSTPYTVPSNTMSEESGYWQPPPYAMQQMPPQFNPGARAPDVPQSMARPEVMQQQNPNPSPQFQHFDARALLNPKTVSKRPATDQEQGLERGREDPSAVGQVSLVERLHHVQERTSSPAKRARTQDEQKKAAKPHAGFGSGGALDLNRNNQQSLPTQGPAIDLTMSKSSSPVAVQTLTIPQATTKANSKCSRTTQSRPFALERWCEHMSRLTRYLSRTRKSTRETMGLKVASPFDSAAPVAS
jgi:hypothetical protein